MVWMGMGRLKASNAWITPNVLQQRIWLKSKCSFRKHFVGPWDSKFLEDCWKRGETVGQKHFEFPSWLNSLNYGWDQNQITL